MRAVSRLGGAGLRHARAMSTKRAPGTPMIMKASVDAYSEGATSLVAKDEYRFLVDEPPKLGGLGKGPNPLTVLLGSLVGCTQYTANVIANEMKLGSMESVAWKAEGEFDLRGVRGNEPGVDARFRRILLEGTVDSPISQQDLDRIAEQVDRRCIVAATLKASGLDMQLRMQKGSIDHNCEPACVMHELAQGGAGGATGKVTGTPGREADAPQFAGTGGQGKPKARGFSTLAAAGQRRGLTTSAPWHRADGEDVARSHLKGSEDTPQLRKETSQEAGADTTRGGAYASRDDPRSQASPPTEGKSEEQIVQEQGAGATISPKSAGSKAEGGQPMAPGGEPAQSPSFAGGGEDAEAAADEAEKQALGRDIDRSDFEPWKE